MQMFAKCSRQVLGRKSAPRAIRLRSLAVTCLFVASAVAQEPRRPSLPDTVDAIVQQHIKSYNIPGLSITAVQQGKIVFSKSYGWSDLENQVPASVDSLFRIGSITKPITATAAFILAGNHQLDLDAPVQRYCHS